jgi:uncharacterized OB-fold protein
MTNSQRYTREIARRYRLEAQKFEDGFVCLPNRYVSPDTGATKFEKINLKPTGTILAFTIIHIPADRFAKESPFPVAIIETEEGCRLTTQIVDSKFEDVKIGGKVELVFRKATEEGDSGILNYGYKAIVL